MPLTLFAGLMSAGRELPAVPPQAGFELVATTPGPSPRRDHAMAFDAARGRVVLHGGVDADRRVLNDTWEWDGTNWREIRWAGGPAFSRHAMVYDPMRRAVLAFSGGAGTGATWTFDGVSWTQQGTGTWGHFRREAGSPPVDASLTFSDSLPGIVGSGGRTITTATESLRLYGWPEPSSGLSPWEVLYLPWTDTILGFAFPNRVDRVGRWTSDPDRRNGRWLEESLLVRTDLDDFAVVADTARRRVFHVAVTGGVSLCEWDGVSRDPATSGRHTQLALEAPGGDLRGGFAMVYDEWRGDVLLFGGEGAHGLSGRLLRLWPVLPRFETFGRGCAGALGEPQLRILAGPPIAGQVLALQLSGVPLGERSPLLYLGFSRTNWLGLPLPFDLGLVGMSGCQLLVAIDHSVPMQALGEHATWGMFLPNLPGMTFYAQAAVFDHRANAPGMVLSNAAATTIGRR